MRKLVWMSVLAAVLTACGPMDESELDGEYDSIASEASAGLAFKAVSVQVPDNLGTSDTRKLVKTAADFQKLFGTSAQAAGVDFARQWVVFYSAGFRSGGNSAAVKSIVLSSSGKTLTVTTSLTSPGKGCIVPMYVMKQATVVAFDKPKTSPSTKWARADVVHDCQSADPCATVRCAGGTHCASHQVQCVRAPCPPVAECVPDATCATTQCGQGTYCSEANGAPECLNYQTCATVRCGSGLTCVDRPIQCVRAPCPPTAPVCVPR